MVWESESSPWDDLAPLLYLEVWYKLPEDDEVAVSEVQP